MRTVSCSSIAVPFALSVAACAADPVAPPLSVPGKTLGQNSCTTIDASVLTQMIAGH